MTRWRQVLLAVTVATAACGGSTATPAEDLTTATPPPGPRARAAAATDVDPVALATTVEVVRPDLRVDDAAPDAARRLAPLDGVRAVVVAATIDLAVPTPAGLVEVTGLAVEPDAFRPFTPEVTANEIGVWERLRDGEAVFTQAAAHRVDGILGETTTLAGPRTTEAVRIGALAANGVPQVADVLLPAELGRRLGDGDPDTLFVALADDVDVDGAAAVIRELDIGSVRVLQEPAHQHAPTGRVGRTGLEPFTYQELGDGTIRIDPGWVRRHIVTADVPVLGRVRCHRLIVPQLSAALEEIVAAGLAGEITDYAGCYVPRHILWDPARGISRHAWGLAFDINHHTNGFGARPTLDRRVVEIFQRWGFAWGGDFSTPDGMHFELARLITD